jgi:5'-nucleotidase
VTTIRRFFAPLLAASVAGASLCACAASDASLPPDVPLVPPAPATTDAAPPPLVHVQILAINDFHGNLEPPSGTNGVVVASPDDPIASLPGTKILGDAGVALVPAGGAAYLATLIAKLRAQNPNTIVVSAGDLTGASPLLSNLMNDEPTVAVMNSMGLDYEAVGNHDFDRGSRELTRLALGACGGDAGACDAGSAWDGATFKYLAANVTDTATNKTVFPPYAIRDFGTGAGHVRVAVIGETLEATPSVASKEAVNGLAFSDEALTANSFVPELKAAGASTIVLLVHQGAMQSPQGTYDSCVGLSGDLLPMINQLDPAIQVVVSGHTHQAYDCVIDGRLVTSAMSYGRLVTKIDLTIDPTTNKVVEQHAKNVPVTRDLPPDPDVARVVEAYATKSAALTGRVVGWVKSDITGNAKAAGSASCETPLGDLIADAQRDATKADVALMNPGGIRADLVAKHAGRADSAVTYADAFEVQPFGNALVTMRLTGAQLKTLFEAQFGSRAEPRILQVSNGFTYRYTFDRATNTGAVDAMKLHGVPIDPARHYSVTVNSFLAAGGDAFKVLKEGTDRQSGGPDIDALVAYLGKSSSQKKPLAPHPLTRITGDGCK